MNNILTYNYGFGSIVRRFTGNDGITYVLASFPGFGRQFIKPGQIAWEGNGFVLN